eukprot:jgi/Psemu1/314801/fgenesh1_kg.1708_\
MTKRRCGDRVGDQNVEVSSDRRNGPRRCRNNQRNVFEVVLSTIKWASMGCYVGDGRGRKIGMSGAILGFH